MATTNGNELSQKIEALVQEHVATLRAEAHATLERTFLQSSTSAGRKAGRPATRQAAATTGRRRTADELSALAERLYGVICKKPGETMAVLAVELGLAPRELARSARHLKDGGRIRSAGQRNQMRYFPLVKPSRQAG